MTYLWIPFSENEEILWSSIMNRMISEKRLPSHGNNSFCTCWPIKQRYYRCFYANGWNVLVYLLSSLDDLFHWYGAIDFFSSFEYSILVCVQVWVLPILKILFFSKVFLSSARAHARAKMYLSPFHFPAIWFNRMCNCLQKPSLSTESFI